MPSVAPVLSLILCSRNDQYMGNSRWRLTTSLNYLAENIRRLGREADVEVVIADWGSDPPLQDVLELSASASRLVRFVPVPQQLALELQRDSPFPEVIGLNAAARRATGEYIGRIDQDTLVGPRFLQAFFELCEGRQQLGVPLASALLFSGHRDIPYRLAVRCPPAWVVEQFVEQRGPSLPVEGSNTTSAFYLKAVGIWLVHRRLWHECGGYDERMIYMNGMEANMMRRLMSKYPMVDLGRMVGHDFYHLEHYHPWAVRKTSTHRKVNPHVPFSEPDEMNPNGGAWGLAAYPLSVASSVRQCDVLPSPTILPTLWRARFLSLLMVVGAQGVCDGVVKAARVWKTRADTAWRAIEGRPLLIWPRLLRDLWVAKRAARRG